MSNTIIVHWEVEDGYVGKSRPQETIIDIEYACGLEEWDVMTKDQRTDFIEECVLEDFNDRISFGIQSIDYGEG